MWSNVTVSNRCWRGQRYAPPETGAQKLPEPPISQPLTPYAAPAIQPELFNAMTGTVAARIVLVSICVDGQWARQEISGTSSPTYPTR